jgi:proteasome accessory factor A
VRGSGPGNRRIMGLETEFGVACAFDGMRRMSPDEVARYMFRQVVSWGRSSNVFLTNGARLYLDVGSHPEYATAECDDARTLVVHDRAGAQIVDRLAIEAEEQLARDGMPGRIYLFKNNTDSAGSSYGCHENYLVGRHIDFNRLTAALVPFLVTRQLVCGAGKLIRSPSATTYALSQRADHIWDGVSSATTRSRPMINTRDEPHADAEKYRRLHVIVGDSTMAEPTTLLKVVACDLVIRAVEQGRALPDVHLDKPIRAIRQVSGDPTGRTLLVTTDATKVSALEVQAAYLDVAEQQATADGAGADVAYALDLWRRGLTAVESGDFDPVATELDWVIKRRLLDRYALRHSLPLSSARMAQLDLSYHDIRAGRGLFHSAESRGVVRRLTTPAEVEAAETNPPPTTRAALRGAFVRRARAAGRDYTADWVHLRLNGRTQHTVMLPDPFAATDERVDALLAEIEADVS